MLKHTQLTARDIHGPYMQLLTNLQGEDGARWLAALKRFNRKENPWDGKPFFRPLKTVRIGDFKSVEHIEQIFREETLVIKELAREVLCHPDFHLAREERELDLVLVTPRELGVVETGSGVHYSQIVQAIQMCGLELCPPEAAVQARRAFTEQLYEEEDRAYLLVAMLPLVDEAGRLAFELNHGEVFREDRSAYVALYLGAYDVDECLWNVDLDFVCVQPRKHSLDSA